MSFREEWIRYGRHDTYTAYVVRPERATEPELLASMPRVCAV
ncbi:MAG: hypothetical protein ACYCYO_07550 [Bacilli bacterium]